MSIAPIPDRDDQQTGWSRRGVLAALGAVPVAAALTGLGGGPARAAAGVPTAATGKTLTASVTPGAGGAYGVGMPVSVTFSHAVTDKAAVERAIRVTADPGVEVVGHWFGDTRLDFRPEKYWAPGTTVTVRLRLTGVRAAAGVHGTQSQDLAFRIGRARISTVDLAEKRMTVVQDGRKVAAYPVTGGNADHATWSGIMVISERLEETRMESSTVGLGHEYDIADVPHAQRLTASGTFVHGNYWTSASVFGHSNSTHGCIGLHDAKGGDDEATAGHAFYTGSRLGDVVVVKNSGRRTVDPANGLNGWNLSWKKWKAGSALAGA
ncbi:Ig-like domain-containing protein [Streptomyces sp. JHA26]|uniref:L,D-transpeptidase n=1 Tax=Streptomyces sp. JHA26 TaxID=1917143 RepID=UPI0015C567B8|nr:Ig-like domain-containing protein [Streptomyces sp. JHA26]